MAAPAVDPEGLRERLWGKAQERWGEDRSRTLGCLAKEARVDRSTLHRILVGGKTRKPHGDTLERVAKAVGVAPDWLLYGPGSPQLALLSAESEPDQSAGAGEPADQVLAALRSIEHLPRDVRIRACRAAVTALLSSVASDGTPAPAEGYRILMILDALQSPPPKRTGGKSETRS